MWTSSAQRPPARDDHEKTSDIHGNSSSCRHILELQTTWKESLVSVPICTVASHCAPPPLSWFLVQRWIVTLKIVTWFSKLRSRVDSISLILRPVCLQGPQIHSLSLLIRWKGARLVKLSTSLVYSLSKMESMHTQYTTHKWSENNKHDEEVWWLLLGLFDRLNPHQAKVFFILFSWDRHKGP